MVKKKNKTKNIANILLNVSIVIMLLGIAYGWMLTEPQIGETIDIVVTSVDIERRRINFDLKDALINTNARFGKNRKRR